MHKVMAGLVLGTAMALAASAQAQEHTIRLAHSLSATEPAHLAAEVFPGEQLGSGKDVNEMIRQGANVMNITDPGYLSDYVPDVGVLNGPYLLADYRDFQKILDSEWLAEIDARLQEAGIRVVSYNNLFGARHMIADVPIRTPADVEGMTVRVPPNQMWLATFEAMGARPTTVQWSEVYNALAQNVVAAAEAPLGSLHGSKLHEVKSTISMTGHFTAWVNFIMSEDFFRSLPEDLQDVILTEGHRAGEEMTRLTLEKQDEYIAMFEEAGITVVDDVDVAAFQEATASVYDAFPQWTPGLHKTIQDILAQ
jgi:tripartite ATP-independent transporter DctP family solute receptor